MKRRKVFKIEVINPKMVCGSIDFSQQVGTNLATLINLRVLNSSIDFDTVCKGVHTGTGRVTCHIVDEKYRFTFYLEHHELFDMAQKCNLCIMSDDSEIKAKTKEQMVEILSTLAQKQGQRIN